MIVYKDAYDKGLTPPRKEYEFIGECIQLIAQRMSNHPWFKNYSSNWKEEMICDAIENCCLYLYNFDPAKSDKPFAYLTQIIYYAFRRRLEKEKKQQYIKMKTTENFFMNIDLNSADAIESKALYENNYDFIKTYEDALNTKKKKGKSVGIEKFIP